MFESMLKTEMSLNSKLFEIILNGKIDITIQFSQFRFEHI